MHIDIQARGFTVTPSLQSYILQRLTRPLVRIRDAIHKIAVRISDDNGPRHGVDKRCLIHITLDGRREVIVQDVSHDMYSAIRKASIRAAQTVKKQLRQRAVGRGKKLSQTLEAQDSVTA